MQKFKVIVEGRNVFMKLDEQIVCMGFFATRLIEADTLERAKQAALKLLKMEVMDIILNPRDNPPAFAVEDAFEVRAADIDHPLSGFTWYPEEGHAT
jgi:hypothetical protein